jgi:hypothetical protein
VVYRKLNDVTKKDCFPLDRIDENLDMLAGAKWFSTLDLKSGYWQVDVHPDDKRKTAFTTGYYNWPYIPRAPPQFTERFERFREARLKLNPGNCQLLQKEVKYRP